MVMVMYFEVAVGHAVLRQEPHAEGELAAYPQCLQMTPGVVFSYTGQHTQTVNSS